MSKPSYHISLFQIVHRAIAISALVRKFYTHAKIAMPKYKGIEYDIELLNSDIFDLEKLKLFFDKLVNDIYYESPSLVCIDHMPLQYIKTKLPSGCFATRENLPFRGVIPFNTSVSKDVYSLEIYRKLNDINSLFSPVIGEAKLAVLPSNILCPLNSYIYNINYVSAPFSELEECNCEVVIQNSLIEDKTMSKVLTKVADDKSELITTLVPTLDVDVHNTDTSIYILATYNIEKLSKTNKVKFSLKFANNETDELMEFISFYVYTDCTDEMIDKIAAYSGFQLDIKTATHFEIGKRESTLAEEKRCKRMSELDKIMGEITIAPPSPPTSDSDEIYEPEMMVGKESLEEFLDETVETPVRKPDVKFPVAPTISSEESIKKLAETFPEAGEW